MFLSACNGTRAPRRLMLGVETIVRDRRARSSATGAAELRDRRHRGVRAQVNRACTATGHGRAGASRPAGGDQPPRADRRAPARGRRPWLRPPGCGAARRHPFVAVHHHTVERFTGIAAPCIQPRRRPRPRRRHDGLRPAWFRQARRARRRRPGGHPAVRGRSRWRNGRPDGATARSRCVRRGDTRVHRHRGRVGGIQLELRISRRSRCAAWVRTGRVRVGAIRFRTTPTTCTVGQATPSPRSAQPVELPLFGR